MCVVILCSALGFTLLLSLAPCQCICVCYKCAVLQEWNWKVGDSHNHQLLSSSLLSPPLSCLILQRHICCASALSSSNFSPFPGKGWPNTSYWWRAFLPPTRSIGVNWMVSDAIVTSSSETVVMPLVKWQHHHLVVSPIHLVDPDKEEAQKVESALSCVK